MADTITLTVRVRDETQAALRRLQAELQNLQRRLSNRGSSGRFFSDIDRAMARFQTRLRAAGRDTNVFDRLGTRLRAISNHLNRSSAFLGRFRGGLNQLGARGLSPLARLADGMGNSLRRLFRGSSDEVGRLRTHLFSVIGAARTLGGTMRTALNHIPIDTRWKFIILAAIVLVGAAAQALGALLVTALGGAFVALGAYALRGNAQVKGAFKDMKSTVGGVVRDAASSLVGPLVSGMQILGQAATGLKPMLTQAFQAAGPIVTSFARAISNLATQAMPGIVFALQNSEGAMQGFESAMGSIGKGFGDMFRIMTQGNQEELARAWSVLGEEIGNVLKSLGEFISTSLNSGTATMIMIGVFRTFTGALNLVAGALRALDGITGNFFKNLADHISGFKGLDTTVADSFDASQKSASQLRQELAGVNKEIDKRNKPLKNYLFGPDADTKQHILDNGDKGSYDKLLSKRGTLQDALKAKTQALTQANQSQVKSIKDLIDATRQLNELNRSDIDAQASMAQAIADGTKAHGKYAHALKMVNGQLDFTSQKSRDAWKYVSDVASSTNAATKAAEDAHAPWKTVVDTWSTGHAAVARLADGMGLTKQQAQNLADQIVKMPSGKNIKLTARTADALNNLDSVVKAMQKAPNSKTITVKALGADARRLLQKIGFDVKQLPNGSFAITAHTGTAKSNLRQVQMARDALKGKGITLSAKDASSGIIAAIKRLVKSLTGKNITITVTRRNILQNIVQGPASSAADALRKQADRFGMSGGSAASLPKKKFATGGSVAGSVLDGPGTSTSDSLVARLSRGEFVMRAAAVRRYGSQFMSMVNEGRLPGFARGGKVSAATKAENDAKNQMRGQFGISFFGKLAGYQHTPFENAAGNPQSLGDLVSALNGLRGQIKAAFHGSKESGLLKQLTNAGKALIKYEKKLSDVNKKLDAAKTKLDDLKQAAASLRDSVTSGVMTATDITQVANGDTNVTLTDVMTQMKQNLDKSTAFASSLTQLKSRGVSKDIINEISQAGINGGGLETAGALLGASDSDIANINAMQKQINANAASAGKTAADAMYGAGIKAAQGLVDGLTKKQKDIEKAMMHIAKAMEKSLKKALGIKSPSRVMMQVGHHTAEGFALGITNNRKVPRAWESLLGTSSRGGVAGAPRGGGDGVYTIPIYVGGRFLDEVILDTNRRLVRTRGGDVQKVFGRK